MISRDSGDILGLIEVAEKKILMLPTTMELLSHDGAVS